MNRINQLFARKKHDILSIYYTAGFPASNDTLRVAQYLEKAGADVLTHWRGRRLVADI